MDNNSNINKDSAGKKLATSAGLGLFMLLFFLGGGAVLAWLLLGGWRILFGAWVPLVN